MVAWVAAVAWVQSLAWELPHTTGVAKKGKKKGGVWVQELDHRDLPSVALWAMCMHWWVIYVHKLVCFIFVLFCFVFLSFCHFLGCSRGTWRFPG